MRYVHRIFVKLIFGKALAGRFINGHKACLCVSVCVCVAVGPLGMFEV